MMCDEFWSSHAEYRMIQSQAEWRVEEHENRINFQKHNEIV